MATNTGDLYVNIRADIKDLKKGLDQATKQIKSFGGKIDKSTKQNENFFKSFAKGRNDVVRLIRQLETLAVASFAVHGAYKLLIGAGLELNKQYQDQSLGIAALITSKTQMLDLNGKELSSYESFIATQSKTKDVMDDIKKASLDTPASFQQMVEFYQQAIGHAITSNGTFGKSIEDVNKNVISMTQGMSALGSSMGMEMKKVNEEIRSLMSGNASTDSLLALVLFGSPSAANEAVRNAKKTTEGLSNLILGALEPFKNVQSVMTYSKAVARLGATFDEMQKGITEDMFDDLTYAFVDLKEELDGGLDAFIQDWKDAYNEAKAFFDITIDALSDIGSNVFDLIGDIGDMTGELELFKNVAIAIATVFKVIAKAVLGVQIALNKAKQLAYEVQEKTGTGKFDELSVMSAKQKQDLNLLEARRYTSDSAERAYQNALKRIKKENELKLKAQKEENTKYYEGLVKQDKELMSKFQKDDLFNFSEMSAQYDATKNANSFIRGIDDAYKGAKNLEEAMQSIRDAAIAAQEASGGNVNILKRIGAEALKAQKAAEGYFLAKNSTTNLLGNGGGDDGSDAEDARKAALKEYLANVDATAKHLTTMLDLQIKLAESGKDWASGLTGVAAQIASVSNEMTKINVLKLKEEKTSIKIQKDYAKAYLKADSEIKDKKKKELKLAELKANFDAEQSALKKAYNRAEIDGYANLAGAMSGAFAEGSEGAKAFMAIQQTLSLYNAVTAVTAAWASAPFPANLPAVASTTMAVVALLGQIGQSFLGDAGGSGATPPALEDINAKTSDSLANALEDVLDVEYTMLSLTRDMRGYLGVIANSFGAIENSLLRSNIDFAGAFYKPTTKSGALGFSSKDYSLFGTTLDFEAATIAEIMAENLRVESNTIIKKVYDSFWKTKTTYFNNYKDVSTLFAEDIADATEALFGGFTAIGEAIGVNMDGLLNEVIDIGLINTTGKSDSEIAEEIEARFSAQTDAIAEEYLSVVREFQKAGEGLAETAFRVAITFEQVGHSMELIGKSVTWRTANIIEAVADGIDGFNQSMNSYMDNFFTEQEQYEMKLNTMTKSFASLGLQLPKTNADFRDLVESIDTTTEAGAVLFAEVISLADGFNEMTSSIVEVGNAMEAMTAIKDAWIGDLSYLTLQQKADYASGYFEIARASNGAMNEVDAALSMVELAMKTATTQEEYIPEFNKYIQTLQEKVPEATLDTVVERLNTLIETVVDLEFTTRQTAQIA